MPLSSVSQVIKKNEYQRTSSNDNSELQVSLNKFIFGKNNEYEVRIADTSLLREKAYRLIYQIYRDKGFIEEHSSKKWYSKFDTYDSTITLVVLKEDVVVGALTLINSSSTGLPAHELYEDRLNGSVRISKQSVELVSLGINPKSRGATEILTKLFNFAYIVSKEIYKKDYFVITVNPRHVPFYIKKLSFEERGEVRQCAKVGGAPSKLLILDLAISKQLISLTNDNVFKSKTYYTEFLADRLVGVVLPILKKQIADSRKSSVEIESLARGRSEVAKEMVYLENFSA